MATNVKSKKQRADQAAELAAGSRKHLAGLNQPIQVGGVQVTTDTLIARLQGIADTRAGVEAAKATAKAKIEAEAAQAPADHAFLNACVSVVRGMFTSADVLADFGLAPRKRTVQTAEKKAVATAKRAATRAARHTLGPKQKKNVKGAVDVSVVVTPSAASHPAALPSPASPSTPAGNAPASPVPAASSPSGTVPPVGATPRAT